jgi:glycine/D-amino acid oxidase-like deaminating enzyme
VLAGFAEILTKLDVHCDLALPGAWEVARKGAPQNSAIDWNDSGKVRVVSEVPGGTLDPGKLVSGLGRAVQRLGAVVAENHPVTNVRWDDRAELEISDSNENQPLKMSAAKVLFATNALSLPLSGLTQLTHAKLTLAAMTAPLSERNLEAIGLAVGKPFYTVDFPYLWGRTRTDRSIVWGAGLVDPPDSRGLEQIDIVDAEPARMFASLEKRVRNLHPALASLEFTHRWGGPISFQDGWRPVFGFHPQSRDAIVLGAYAGHGVALSSYLGAWAAEALLGKRQLPEWGAVER